MTTKIRRPIPYVVPKYTHRTPLQSPFEKLECPPTPSKRKPYNLKFKPNLHAETPYSIQQAITRINKYYRTIDATIKLRRMGTVIQWSTGAGWTQYTTINDERETLAFLIAQFQKIFSQDDKPTTPDYLARLTEAVNLISQIHQWAAREGHAYPLTTCKTYLDGLS